MRGWTAVALTMIPFTMTRRPMCSAPILLSGVSAGRPLNLTWSWRIWLA